MRFMMLMIPKGYESAAPGTMPDAEAVAAMMKYNEALQKAGVLLALDGLHPPSMGARVTFEGGKPKVTDGPFAEAKEVLGGYWMIQVKSKEEAHRVGQALPGVRQRDDRGPPGAGDGGLPRRRAEAARARRAVERQQVLASAAPAGDGVIGGRGGTDTHRAIDAVWRIESREADRRPRAHGARRRPGRGAGAGRAGRRARAAGRATASRDNPGAWLMATAKHRAIDALRRRKLLERKHERARPRARGAQATTRRPISTPRSTTTIGDDLLR